MKNEFQPLNFKKIFETAPGLFLVLRPDPPQFTIVAVSDAYLKLTHKKRNEILGRGLFEAFSLEPQNPYNPLANGVDDLRNSLLQAIRTGMPAKMAEQIRSVRRSGQEGSELTEEFWSSVNTPVLSDGGQILNVIYSIQNATFSDALALVEAREMLEARVKERTQDLLRSNTELEQFAYIASHDLQTPLRHISSYVQLLTSRIKKTNALDAKAEKWIDYILSGTQQMKSLISDLLSYSRIGRLDIEVEEIDLAKLLVHVMDELRDPLRATNAKIIYGETPKIFGIKSQIEQLFQNLIENALKFKKSDIDPIVKIHCEDHVEFWKFSVSDNGIGIDSKYAERIFLMFHRLHSNDQYAGTGIGLAICKKIIEFHGGKIWLDSEEKKGAIFYFTLPKKERVTSIALNRERRVSP